MILSERNLFIYPRMIHLPNDHGAAAKTRGNYHAHLICVAPFHVEHSRLLSRLFACPRAKVPQVKPQHAPLRVLIARRSLR